MTCLLNSTRLHNVPSLFCSVLAASDADLAEEDEAVDKDDVANLKKKWVPCGRETHCVAGKLRGFAVGIVELAPGGTRKWVPLDHG